MADLPGGAVTLLFTDIEGSTQLVKRLRHRYGEVLSAHQKLLREAAARHAGHEVDTQGDSFFFAFSSARDAVLAAVEAQRALAAHEWPEDGIVAVRMGVHTGHAAPSDGRYTGVAVHRAARLCAAGHGGQVLVSQATQTMLEDEEEDLEIELRDLGEHRLKDLDRPVRVFQAVAPGLPHEFPPLHPQAELAAAAEAAIEARAPIHRRPYVLAVAAFAVAGFAAVGLLLVTSRSGGGLAGADPNHVAIIDSETGEIVSQIQVGVAPGPIAIGKDAVWVGNREDRTLTRIDPGKRETVRTVPLNGRTPTGLAVDDDGAVWVAHGLTRLGSISRVDPQYNQVAQTIEVADADAVTVGRGAVWTVRESTLSKINPATRSVQGTTFAGSGPNAIAYGERALWVANAGEASVSRFNPRTFENGPVRTITVGRRPSAIAVGEGAVWVANTSDDRVSRIDPFSNSATTIDVGDGPSAIAVGEGAVWVANSADGTISKLDPATSEVVDRITVGNFPSGITVGAGLVWVTVQAS